MKVLFDHPYRLRRDVGHFAKEGDIVWRDPLNGGYRALNGWPVGKPLEWVVVSKSRDDVTGTFPVDVDNLEWTGEMNFNLYEAAKTLTGACHAASYNAGWWHDREGKYLADNPLTFSNKLCLIHSEISEAMEGDRKGKMDDHLPSRPMREVELADALIRIFDLAGAYGLDVAGALVDKMAYNATRADHKKEVRESSGGKAY